MSAAVVIHGGKLTTRQVMDVAMHGAKVELAQPARKAIENGYQKLLTVEEKIGPVPLWKMADLSDDDSRSHTDDLDLLARRVIVDHAAAVGDPLPTALVRAAMLVRADVLAQGHSGVRTGLVETLIAMLNAGVHPVVPARGHLSVAGDLAPLAHIALVLCEGGGEVEGDTGAAVIGRHEDGDEIVDGAEAMRRTGIDRWQPTLKESFSLLVGTSMACGRAALLIEEAQRLWRLAAATSAVTCEAMLANASAFDPALHSLGPGRETMADVAATILSLTDDSQMVAVKTKPDAFSLRCIPQVLGPIRNVIDRTAQVVEEELRLVSDNPLIVDGDEGPRLLEGGNFHGERLALALDNLRVALAEVGALAERHAFLMTNRARSNGLPSFLVRNRGLNSGFMLAQYTAAALVSENKTLAMPYATDSIPACQDYEDHGGLSSQSAAACEKVAENVRRILAIELLCAAQGVDLRVEDGLRPGRFAQGLVNRLRETIPTWNDDTVMYRYLERVDEFCRADGVIDGAVGRAMEQIDGR